MNLFYLFLIFKFKKNKIYSKTNKNDMHSFLNPFLPILTIETMIYHGHHTVYSLRFPFLQSFTVTIIYKTNHDNATHRSIKQKGRNGKDCKQDISYLLYLCVAYEPNISEVGQQNKQTAEKIKNAVRKNQSIQ